MAHHNLPEAPQELISLRTLAQLLDCSPKTIRDWLYRNRKQPTADPLPYYRLGGLIRFKLNEVTKWIDRRRVRVSSIGSLVIATPGDDNRL